MKGRLKAQNKWETLPKYSKNSTLTTHATLWLLYINHSFFLCVFLVSELHSKVGRWYMATEYSGCFTEMPNVRCE